MNHSHLNPSRGPTCDPLFFENASIHIFTNTTCIKLKLCMWIPNVLSFILMYYKTIYFHQHFNDYIDFMKITSKIKGLNFKRYREIFCKMHG